MGTGFLSPGVKRPGRGVNHPSPSSAEVKERVELYLYSPSGPLWSLVGRFTFYADIYLEGNEKTRKAAHSSYPVLVPGIEHITSRIWCMSGAYSTLADVTLACVQCWPTLNSTNVSNKLVKTVASAGRLETFGNKRQAAWHSARIGQLKPDFTIKHVASFLRSNEILRKLGF